MLSAMDVEVVRNQVSALISNKIIIGHSLWIHLSVSTETFAFAFTQDGLYN